MHYKVVAAEVIACVARRGGGGARREVLYYTSKRTNDNHTAVFLPCLMASLCSFLSWEYPNISNVATESSIAFSICSTVNTAILNACHAISAYFRLLIQGQMKEVAGRRSLSSIPPVERLATQAITSVACVARRSAGGNRGERGGNACQQPLSFWKTPPNKVK